MKNVNICVIGGGVIGISTAVNIIENVSDITVDIIAEEFSPHTTSDIAGGLWHSLDIKDATSLKLAEITFQYMRNLSTTEDAGQVGACMVSCYTVSQNKLEHPAIKHVVNGFHEMDSGELDSFPGYRFGHVFATFLVECNKYLPWLMKRFVQRGGRTLNKKISSMSELAASYDIVVNCTGLGAHDLVHDAEVKPSRGQMIRVKAPWIKNFIVDQDSFCYIIPRSDHVLLGGTYEMGNHETRANLETRERIMAGCLKLMPSLKYASFEGDLVALRPFRPTVRLEAEEMAIENKKLQIVHNYGHSGSGITLHWGCAQKATSLVQEAVNRIRLQSKL